MERKAFINAFVKGEIDISGSRVGIEMRDLAIGQGAKAIFIRNMAAEDDGKKE